MAWPEYRIPVPALPNFHGFQTFQRQAIEAFRQAFNGRINTAGSFTLGASDTTTVVTHPELHENSALIAIPTNAGANTLGWPYPSSRGAGTATFTHGSASGGETYTWIALA